jgi:DNA polymerase III epsilon subunit-like protein
MNNFMLDLETLGTTPGCAILSIGIIAFDPVADRVDNIFNDHGFYTAVSKESCLDALLHVDPDTVAWWSKQSAEARKALTESEKPDAPTLSGALENMVGYVTGFGPASKARIWGNGADFDNPILDVAALHAGVKLPWKYGGRCHRTIKTAHEHLAPGFEPPVLARSGTHHNALDDARTQALYHWEYVRELKEYLVREAHNQGELK